jgi:large conductance mechanosensitive channel
MLKGFKDFVLRGNFVDLAVGIAVGASFTALVSQFGKSFIEPLVKVFSGGGAAGGTFAVRRQTFDYGAFVNAALTFLLTAAVLYFLVVVPMNRLFARRKEGTEPEAKAPSEDVVLLQEIRDLLRQRGA